MNYKSYEKQCVFDIALHYYGNIDTAFKFAAANGLSVTDVIDPGTELIMPTQNEIPDVLHVFVNRGIIPATDVSLNQTGEQRLEGIDYWAILTEFEIQ